MQSRSCKGTSRSVGCRQQPRSNLADALIGDGSSRIRSTYKLDSRRVLTGSVCYRVLRIDRCLFLRMAPTREDSACTDSYDGRRTMLSQATHPHFRHRRLDLEAPRHLINKPDDFSSSRLGSISWHRVDAQARYLATAALPGEAVLDTSACSSSRSHNRRWRDQQEYGRFARVRGRLPGKSGHNISQSG